MIGNGAVVLLALRDTKDGRPMTQNWHPARRGGALAALLLSLLLALSACGGVASPTAAPASTATVFNTSTPAAGGASGVGGPTPTRAAPTPAAVSATATSAALPVAPSATATPAAATSIAPTTTVAPTVTALPTLRPAPTVAAVPRAGQPVRLQIPSIKVDAAIEYVGLTPNGDMDAPKNYDNTAWYELGARPGDIGNAAIAGHVDSKTRKAVFWDLAKLKPGNEIFVVGDDGVTRRFVVTALDSYERTDAPLQQIFGPTPERHLNIITCDSSTPFSNGHYAANVVVYTTYVP
jgi:hypothetical protein